MGKIFLILFILSGMHAMAQPELKGGLESFLVNNKVYPPYSLQNCIEGTVTISFKLNDAGEVYFSKVQRGIGTDLDDEALRLIRMSSGKWELPEGHDSTTAVVVPIKFRLADNVCGNKNKQEIKLAIATYQANMAQTNAVLNFYKNKPDGKFTKEEEARIVSLKNTLGYDDVYFRQRVADGMKKLKQKDKQGACEDFLFVKYMGSDLADDALAQYCN